MRPPFTPYELPRHNLNTLAWLTRIDDADNPGTSVRLDTLAGRIIEMDMPEELRNGHVVGMLAAQQTLNYLETHADPVYEQAKGVGMLAALGCYITDEEPLLESEIDHASTYQRIMLHMHLLDNIGTSTSYSPNLAQHFSSVAAKFLTVIRMNPFAYLNGRPEFDDRWMTMVDKYIDTIRTTEPTGQAIAEYMAEPELQPLVSRFVDLRRSLQHYVPELRALNHSVWHDARQYIATQNITDVRGKYGVGEQNLVTRDRAAQRGLASAPLSSEPAA